LNLAGRKIAFGSVTRKMDFIAQSILMTGFCVWWWFGFKLKYFSRRKKKAQITELKEQTSSQDKN
jgi:hypothetical protein